MAFMFGPDTLWHYTDSQGFFGIVSSGCLRFSDAEFLNDRTERRYGAALLASVFDEFVRGDPSGLAKDFCDLARVMRLDERLYVCSLSANEESISQWQRYGADGNGYALGFSTRELDAVLDEDGVSRHEMIYEESMQQTILVGAILAGLREYQRLKEEEARGSKPHYSAYLFTDMDIRRAELQMKNPFFRDEQEWRYFVTADTDDDVTAEEPGDDDVADGTVRGSNRRPQEQFAPRGHHIKPFLELPYRRDVAKPLPITRVICGPRLDRDIAIPTAARFLRSNGHTAHVEQSRLSEIWR